MGEKVLARGEMDPDDDMQPNEKPPKANGIDADAPLTDAYVEANGDHQAVVKASALRDIESVAANRDAEERKGEEDTSLAVSVCVPFRCFLTQRS